MKYEATRRWPQLTALAMTFVMAGCSSPSGYALEAPRPVADEATSPQESAAKAAEPSNDVAWEVGRSPISAAVTGQSSVANESIAVDGEQLFKAVYFGQGEIAGELSEVWDRKELSALRHLDPAQKAAVEQLVRAVADGNEGFFQQFAVETRSGDHVRVQAAITGGAKQIARLVVPSDSGQGGGQCVFVLFGSVVLVAVGAVIVAAAAYFLAAAAQVAVYQTSAVGGGGDDGPCTLRRDGDTLRCRAKSDDPEQARLSNAEAGARELESISGSSTPRESTLKLDEYVDLIARRLATGR